MSSPAVALLSANELTLAFGHQQLLAGVTLSVAPGEKVGLVGRNGCGKTSLLKILAGTDQPDGGEVSRRRGLRIGYLPQEFELDGTKTVRENIEAGAADLLEWLRCYEAGEGSEAELAELLDKIQHADGWNLEARIKAEAHALSAPPLDALVGPLSGGEKRRVALCRALASQPDLLLLDEPTNHLDSESIRWLEDFLHDFPGAVIFVTHDRYFLDVIATRIIEIDFGRAFSHPGNYTAYLESKAIRQGIAEQGERRRQRFLRVELDWVKAGVRAQRSKAKHRLDTFYAVKGLEAPPEEREMDLLIPPAPELGNVAVELINAGAKVGTGDQERWLFRNLKLSLKPGQCTGVVGRNGVGKTTLLRLCLGERAPEEGTVTVGKKVVFNYIDQARMQLDYAGTVMDQVSDKNEIVHFGGQPLSARTYLKRFLFEGERVKERIDRLSGGERARLMLAKVLCRGGNVIVLDEPTNDLDLQSLRMLEEALADFDGSVLVVSHDRYFLDRICDQIVAFEDGVGVHVQGGNYSYYLEQRKLRGQHERQLAEKLSTPAVSSAPVAAPKSAKSRKLSFKEQRELDGMEATIAAIEARVAELEEQLNDPKFYAERSREVSGVLLQIDAGKAETARLYARWEALEQLGK
ncbi:MAG: ABC-F family ATP-binding cassette domain-containing protein [Verrucomicrobia bacterium]|nr:ABC-F family ATP-binding cassette domain-containing protein [Verrucomicrobiota bacterium]